MARLPRVVIAEMPHHVTQRGNARRFVLDCDLDRTTYLKLLREDIAQCTVGLLGYCLMSNHVHLIMVPHQSDGLAKSLKRTHARYASYWNARNGINGHLWQGRFYSCPLDPTHLWRTLRYSELNPVRAGMVQDPGSWPWSSAAAHMGRAQAEEFLDLQTWGQHWTTDSWRVYLTGQTDQEELGAIRRCTYTGRPLGSTEFLEDLERQTQRRLILRKGGRPKTKLRAPKPGL